MGHASLEPYLLALLQGCPLGSGYRVLAYNTHHLLAEGVEGVSCCAVDRLRFDLVPQDSPYPLTVGLWCRRIKRRHVRQSIALGGVVATVLALAFGWLIVLSVPLSIGTALATYLWSWRRSRRRLDLTLSTFSQNLRYLDRSNPARADATPSPAAGAPRL